MVTGGADPAKFETIPNSQKSLIVGYCFNINSLKKYLTNFSVYVILYTTDEIIYRYII